MAERSLLPTVVTPAFLAVAVLLVGSLSYNLAHLDTGPELLPPIPPLGGLGSGPGGDNTTAGGGGGAGGRRVPGGGPRGAGLLFLFLLALVRSGGSLAGTRRGGAPPPARGPAGPP